MSKKHKKSKKSKKKTTLFERKLNNEVLPLFDGHMFLDDNAKGLFDTLIIPVGLRAAVREVGWWNSHAEQLRYWDSETERSKKFAKDKTYRKKFIAIFEEEAQELINAAKKPDVELMLDGIGDVLFTLFGLACAAGLDDQLGAAFMEVCESNETKLRGEQRKDAEGKLMKGDEYKPPRFDLITKSITKKV